MSMFAIFAILFALSLGNCCPYDDSSIPDAPVITQSLPQALSVLGGDDEYDYLFDPAMTDENQLVWNFGIFNLSNSSNVTNLSNLTFMVF
jgi:hypothetical protein